MKIALAWIDQLAAGAFLSEGSAPLLDWCTASARSLCGADRNDARVRLAARAIAVGRAQQLSLEAALGEAVARRDYDGAALISRTLDGISRRLQMWLREHRASCGAGERSVAVTINGAAAVTIDGAK